MQDIILDTDLDLSLQNGDFVVSRSDDQHIQLLLETGKGDWRELPFVGVGVRAFLKGAGVDSSVRQEIRKQLKIDGAKTENIIITEQKITVNGKYD